MIRPSKRVRLHRSPLLVLDRPIYRLHQDVRQQPHRPEEHAPEDARHDGEVRDPDGGKIGESGVEKIRQQVTYLGELFDRVGIVPGSEEALRLF